LRPVGLDLSAFALVRALYAPPDAAEGDGGAVLYAHVAGSTTMAIADGPDCRFTRVSTAGFDTFAAQLAERAEIATDVARHRLVAAGADGLSDDALARAVLEAGADQLGEALRP